MRAGVLSVGDVIDVAETVTTDAGIVRMRFGWGEEEGWTSLVSQKGNVMLEKTDDDAAVTPRPPPTPTPSKPEEQEEGEVSTALLQATGLRLYDVKQGRKELQLQVGGQGLQIFRKGKPIENFLYKDMANWTCAMTERLSVQRRATSSATDIEKTEQSLSH